MLSVRLGPEMFKALDDYINSFPWSNRPSKDAVAQQAIRELIAKRGQSSTTAPEPTALDLGDPESWPRDVRDGEELVREFIAILKHPAKGDLNARHFMIEHLRDPDDKAERAKAKEVK